MRVSIIVAALLLSTEACTGRVATKRGFRRRRKLIIYSSDTIQREVSNRDVVDPYLGLPDERQRRHVQEVTLESSLSLSMSMITSMSMSMNSIPSLSFSFPVMSTGTDVLSQPSTIAPSLKPTRLSPQPSHQPLQDLHSTDPSSQPTINRPKPSDQQVEVATTDPPSANPTTNPTYDLANWKIHFVYLGSSFANEDDNEITLNYLIAHDRTYHFSMMKRGCIEPITGTNITFISTSYPNDSSFDNLVVSLDLDKSTIASSNIWVPDSNNIEMCTILSLLDGSQIITLDARNISVELLFDIGFDADATASQLIVGSTNQSTSVNEYIEACTCDNASSFTCNANSLSKNDYLNVCIKSLSAEVEIEYLDNIRMIQGTEKEFVIVQGKSLLDSTLSSQTMVAAKNGIHLASMIPIKFFSYDSDSTAVVTGAVYLKFNSGNGRRVAVEINGNPKVEAAMNETTGRALQPDSDNDEQSAFAIQVKLKKIELRAPANTNDAKHFSISGFIVAATIIASVAAIVMI